MNDSLQVASYLEYEQAAHEEELYDCDACGDAYPESEMSEPFLAYYSYESGPEYGQLCLKCENEAEAQEEAWEEARAEDAEAYARYQYEELK